MRPDALVVPQVAVVAGAQNTVSTGADVTWTGLNDTRPAAASWPFKVASAATKLPAFSEKPCAPNPPKAPNGSV